MAQVRRHPGGSGPEVGLIRPVPVQDDPQSGREAVAAIERDWRGFRGRRMVLWAVRWTIGLAVIAAVVHFQPEWGWLWWAGLGFAALTPLSAAAAHWFVGRKLRQAEASIMELEAALAGLEGESKDQGEQAKR